MTTPAQRRLIIGLFLTAMALVDGVLWSFGSVRNRPDVAGLVVVGFLFVQASLLGVWFGSSRLSFPLRLFFAAALIIGWGFLAHRIGSSPADVVMMVLAAGRVVVIALPLVVLRAVGLNVTRLDGDSARSLHDTTTRFQFSLASLFLLMTVMAVILAAVKTLLASNEPAWKELARPDVAVFLFDTLVTASVSIWVTLGRGTILLRSTLIASAAIILYWVASVVTRPDQAMLFILFFGVETAVLVASLSIFRVAGYRLRWRRRGTGESSASSL